ncbi:MAG: SDR family oxidoreductase [Candidatus Dojkabacteria bacterium]|nr:MAG: SDR family oxidoreductase [Candidatus Dojkabacteria bacterium]
MNLGLKDKKIVVTGGASGIGKAIALDLCREGAFPIIIDRDESALLRLRKEIGDARIKTFVCDLSDCLETKQVISQINKIFGDEIYGLVNNAGVNDGVSLLDGISAFQASLQRNLIHYFQMTSGLMESIKKNQGSILNISSKVAETGQGGTSGYAAAKGAINALTREWALELAQYGVDVNCIVPAEVITPQYEKWIKNESDSRKVRNILRKINLGKRLTRPEEVADFAIFLLSQRNTHTTGQLVFVDGGYTHLDDSTSV